MAKFLSFLLKSVAYGLALAFVLMLLFPSLRQATFPFQTSFNTTQDDVPVSYAKAVRRAAPAVVNVYTRSTLVDPRSLRPRTIERQELGSGVVMSAQGYILTNYHVVYGADYIEVALQDGRTLEAVLIGQDEISDLAVLYVQADNLPVIPQDLQLEPQVGDVVLAIGNPLNLGQTITQGIISAAGNTGLSSRGYPDFMRMDAAINRGNSGGALVNSNGTLIGINAAAFQVENQDIQGIFFAVPYKLAINVMEKLIKQGRVSRSHLGVTGDAVINAAGEPLLSSGQRLYGFSVTAINANGPAAEAGLQIGDIVLEVDGKRFESIQQALNMIAEAPPNSALPLTVDRAGQRLIINTIVRELRR
ncbi:trypsin-like peptidase domain-containing protein [Rheinheimera muenzenbergensis]|uniref:Trypsin-like peptidase domain-containing protein n=1 Tax=Rheinheimera muenzenbergensis TaxID=1193628 RepID=A0ABU8CA36_9GAMM|nr:trypsin-like peptidase domain-containing protein [Gammaproteobacteria bacterium]MBU1555253.1 trypsin-like peptidase domain-containing protein [Gammaproteobacteria bacterium]MBU2068919.1 trypsin-like peptidase domain-containing protein [Gammaproteobacteria bacterium]MBU2181425.1 trypsin-like peptidase domain-containing protein [Gammaproteobacteria bacterium]MBU2203828.1 trypsin-like peptidase domain-containing protein [Gammaproteobacteria bacterium]